MSDCLIRRKKKGPSTLREEIDGKLLQSFQERIYAIQGEKVKLSEIWTQVTLQWNKTEMVMNNINPHQ